MQVDIIIPTYNRVTLLERAIESVLKQTYQNFELYITDDGSEDETPDLMQKYSSDPRLHYLKQDNKGVSAARNLGIDSSCSPWIALLDSDDEWLPKKLETQIEFLKKNSWCRFLHSEEIWIRDGVRVNPPAKFRKSGEDLFERSLELCLVSPTTVLMARDLFLEFGPFDEEMVVCEDYAPWIKILAQEKVGFIPEALARKYGGHEQLSTKYFAMDYYRLKGLVHLLEKSTLHENQKQQVLLQIEKKGKLLSKGYEKHQNVEKLKEVSDLLKRSLLL